MSLHKLLISVISFIQLTEPLNGSFKKPVITEKKEIISEWNQTQNWSKSFTKFTINTIYKQLLFSRLEWSQIRTNCGIVTSLDIFFFFGISHPLRWLWRNPLNWTPADGRFGRWQAGGCTSCEQRPVNKETLLWLLSVTYHDVSSEGCWWPTDLQQVSGQPCLAGVDQQ